MIREEGTGAACCARRVSRWTDEIYRSQPVEVHFPDPSGAEQLDHVYNPADLVFPLEGYYLIDLLLDAVVRYTVQLLVVQIK